jgi:hypothetical protein
MIGDMFEGYVMILLQKGYWYVMIFEDYLSVLACNFFIINTFHDYSVYKYF